MGILFRNLRIQTKLWIGFLICILLSSLIGIAGITNMKFIDTKYTALLNGAVSGSQKGEEMGKEYAKARFNLLLAAYIGDNSTEVQQALHDFDTSINKIVGLLKWQITSIQNDPIFSKEPQAIAAIGQTENLLNRLTVDYVGVRNEIEAEIKRGSVYGDVGLALLKNTMLVRGEPIANEINIGIDGFVAETKMAVEETSKQTTVDVDRNIFLITIFVVIAVLISMISSLLIGRNIRKPIEKLRAASHKIAGGDFSVQIRSNGKDEISDLSNMFGNIIDMFSLIVNEIDKSYSKLVPGKMDVAMDEAIFPGDYKKAVSAVNNMTNDFHGILGALIQCTSDYSRGKFDTTIIRFPGEQAFVHEVFDTLQGNLKAMSTG